MNGRQKLSTFKVWAGIAAPLVLGIPGIYGGEAHYRSQVDGLEPHQVKVTWQDKMETYDKKVVTTTTQKFSGLGNAEVTGRLHGDKHQEVKRWVIPPDQTFSDEIIFERKPNITFESDDYALIRECIFCVTVLLGHGGFFGAFFYALGKGYLYK